MNDKSVKICVFYCTTSYDQTQLMRNFSLPGNEMKIISLPCSGKLDILYLIKAFETGADGVAVMMCKEGECRYLEGNMRARKRAEVVEELLKETGFGEGRVSVIQMDDGGIEKKIRELEDFCLKISSLTQGNQPKRFQPDKSYDSQISPLNKENRV
jgi:coenzyme F420-reducing hydrogenase delta subunit